MGFNLLITCFNYTFLFRIHAQSSKGLPESHPENRAILFEEKVYSKKKINDFISVLNGFESLQDIVSIFQGNLVSFKAFNVFFLTGLN